MAEPIVVEVRRNGVVEAGHRVHAVAVREGEIVAAAGDPVQACFMRSSSKPLQALPLVRSRDDLPDDELAVACASHRDTPEQIAAVRALLARAEATEDDLELGPQEGRPPELIHNNCSGNHAGMLALCRAHGWRTEGYRLPDHPVQQTCLDAHAEAAELEPGEIRTGVDGCGIVTFELTLERMAHAFSRLASLQGGDRVASAMRARPDLVGGPDGADYFLMREAPGWLAKGGAEGLLCAAGPDGTGIAIKTEDGSSRAHAPALAALLARLGIDLPDFAARPILNTRGDRVGEIATAGSGSI
ncbi:MAG TPA: asparaginase [Gaiellaceae bacterium]|nr:asparaginase [Gaiellaceae bacterium]